MALVQTSPISHGRLRSAQARRKRIGAAQISALGQAGALPSGEILARLLIAHLADAPEDDSLDEACRTAILASAEWRELSLELLNHPSITPQTARLFCRVVAARTPDHPAAAFARAATVYAKALFDAIDDGELIRVRLEGLPDQAAFRTLLLGQADPLTTWSWTRCVRKRGAYGWFSVDRSSALFQPPRAAPRPMILLADV